MRIIDTLTGWCFKRGALPHLYVLALDLSTVFVGACLGRFDLLRCLYATFIGSALTLAAGQIADDFDDERILALMHEIVPEYHTPDAV